jgi:hypothetical protein
MGVLADVTGSMSCMHTCLWSHSAGSWAAALCLPACPPAMLPSTREPSPCCRLPQALAKSLDIPYMEASAKDDSNVQEAFMKMAVEMKSRWALGGWDGMGSCRGPGKTCLA